MCFLLRRKKLENKGGIERIFSKWRTKPEVFLLIFQIHTDGPLPEQKQKGYLKENLECLQICCQHLVGYEGELRKIWWSKFLVTSKHIFG